MSSNRPLNSRVRETLTIGGLLLIVISLLMGAAIPLFASPRLALSTHLTGVQGGMMLMIFGLIWRKQALGTGAQHVACWLLQLGTWLVWLGNLLGSIYATGRLTPIASNNTVGTFNNEMLVAGVLGSGSLLLVIGVMMLLRGLLRHRAESVAAAD